MDVPANLMACQPWSARQANACTLIGKRADRNPLNEMLYLTQYVRDRQKDSFVKYDIVGCFLLAGRKGKWMMIGLLSRVLVSVVLLLYGSGCLFLAVVIGVDRELASDPSTTIFASLLLGCLVLFVAMRILQRRAWANIVAIVFLVLYLCPVLFVLAIPGVDWGYISQPGILALACYLIGCLALFVAIRLMQRRPWARIVAILLLLLFLCPVLYALAIPGMIGASYHHGAWFPSDLQSFMTWAAVPVLIHAGLIVALSRKRALEAFPR